MDTANLSISIAFLAGLLSFASPCVLPLVPAYMGYLGGTTLTVGAEDGARRDTARLFAHSLMFVLGFGLVFIPLGASASFIGRLLFDSTILLQRLGGVLLVVFGMRLMAIDWGRRRWLIAAIVVALATFLLDSRLLVQGSIALDEYTVFWVAEALMMGLAVAAGADWKTWQQVLLAVVAGFLNFQASYDLLVPNLATSALIVAAIVLLNRTDFFYAEKKIEVKQARQATYARSLLFGIVFAAGWTPCVGPILAGILILASQLDTVGQGTMLLTAYTLGLGIPFLLVGLAFGPLSRWLRRMNHYLGIISVVSGVLLVIMGVLVFADSLAFLAQYGSFFELDLP